MHYGERIINIALGISLIYWAYAGFVLDYDGVDTPPIRLFISLLNLVIGVLILFRKPVIVNGSIKSVVISLPSLLLGGVLFKLSLPLSDWNLYLIIFFLLGGLITVISFVFLGRSFAIFPGKRQIVSKGFYKIIRHPSYFGEIIMIAVCAIANGSFLALFIFLGFIPAMIYRINVEEKLLLQDAEYQRYGIETKWRLIPYVW